MFITFDLRGVLTDEETTDTLALLHKIFRKASLVDGHLTVAVAQAFDPDECEAIRDYVWMIRAHVARLDARQADRSRNRSGTRTRVKRTPRPN